MSPFRHRVLNGLIGLHPCLLRAGSSSPVCHSITISLIETISQISCLGLNASRTIIYHTSSPIEYNHSFFIIRLSLLLSGSIILGINAISVRSILRRHSGNYYYLYLYYHDSIRFTRASTWLRLLLYGAYVWIDACMIPSSSSPPLSLSLYYHHFFFATVSVLLLVPSLSPRSDFCDPHLFCHHWFTFTVVAQSYVFHHCVQSSICISSLFRLCIGDAMSSFRSFESHDSGRHLWRTALCRHGPSCTYPGCRFAHSLCDLRRPDETVAGYQLQWDQGHIDRFYGQRMTEVQLRRIRKYYLELPSCDVPLWAIGLRLLVHGRESSKGFAYPWDFGLLRDYDDLLEARIGRSCPFEIWPELWARLNRRREILLAYEHPPHLLGLNTPRSSMPEDEVSNVTQIPTLEDEEAFLDSMQQEFAEETEFTAIKQEPADESDIGADCIDAASRSRSRSMSRGSFGSGL